MFEIYRSFVSPYLHNHIHCIWNSVFAVKCCYDLKLLRKILNLYKKKNAVTLLFGFIILFLIRISRIFTLPALLSPCYLQHWVSLDPVEVRMPEWPACISSPRTCCRTGCCLWRSGSVSTPPEERTPPSPEYSDWLIDWFIDWSINHLINWLFTWLFTCFVDILVNSLTHWFIYY